MCPGSPHAAPRVSRANRGLNVTTGRVRSPSRRAGKTSSSAPASHSRDTAANTSADGVSAMSVAYIARGKVNGTSFPVGQSAGRDRHTFVESLLKESPRRHAYYRQASKNPFGRTDDHLDGDSIPPRCRQFTAGDPSVEYPTASRHRRIINHDTKSRINRLPALGNWQQDGALNREPDHGALASEMIGERIVERFPERIRTRTCGFDFPDEQLSVALHESDIGKPLASLVLAAGNRHRTFQLRTQYDLGPAVSERMQLHPDQICCAIDSCGMRFILVVVPPARSCDQRLPGRSGAGSALTATTNTGTFASGIGAGDRIVSGVLVRLLLTEHRVDGQELPGGGIVVAADEIDQPAGIGVASGESERRDGGQAAGVLRVSPRVVVRRAGKGAGGAHQAADRAERVGYQVRDGPGGQADLLGWGIPARVDVSVR